MSGHQLKSRVIMNKNRRHKWLSYHSWKKKLASLVIMTASWRFLMKVEQISRHENTPCEGGSRTFSVRLIFQNISLMSATHHIHNGEVFSLFFFSSSPLFSSSLALTRFFQAHPARFPLFKILHTTCFWRSFPNCRMNKVLGREYEE